MKKLTLVAAMSALLLAACGHHHEYHQQRYPGADSAKPVLAIAAGSPTPSISVSPRTLVFLSDQKDVEIVWTIPKVTEPGAKQFRFAPGKGIVIVGEVKLKVQQVPGNSDLKAAYSSGGSDGADVTYIDPKQDQIVNCRGSDDGLEYRCLNRHTRPGRFKYAIQFTAGGEFFAVDPLVDNW